MGGNVIEVPEAPRISGLLFREFAGEGDYPAIVEVANESMQADGVKGIATPEIIATMDGFVAWVDRKKDRVVAEVDGVVVGVGRVQCERNVSGERIYFSSGNVRPAWRRKGIGRAILGQSERRLREIAAGHPRDGKRFFLSFLMSERQVGAIALLEKSGYKVLRYSVDMVNAELEKLPKAELPDGLEIRPVREEDLRQIWDAKEEAFADLWDFMPCSQAAFNTWRKDPMWRKDLSSVAWAGSEVVGMVLGLVVEEENRKFNRRRIYTESICVRRSWRRRGVARALIADCVRLARVAGFAEAALSVNAQNQCGALRVYESMGYRVVEKSIFFRKPMD